MKVWNKKISAIILLSIIGLAWINEGCERTDQVTDLGGEMQYALDSTFARSGAVGVSAAVYVPGVGSWTGASGNSCQDRVITSEMIFPVASITKSFVAVVVLQLAAEGILSLDDPLHKWLPLFPYVDSMATIRQLLNHTSGIYSVDDNEAFWDAMFSDFSRIWTPAEVLNGFMCPPYFAPGSGWHYSNTDYILLGLVVEKATGSSLSTQLRERIFLPLRMNGTFLLPDEIVTGEQAHRWEDVNDDGIREDLTVQYSFNAHASMGKASGAMLSTGLDLIQFSCALHEGDLLSKASYSEMLSFVPTGQSYEDCGLGMFHKKNLFDGVQAYGHDGSTHGALARMCYLPEYGIHIVVLLNSRDVLEGFQEITTALGRVALKHRQ